MKALDDPIVAQAYSELMINCQREGCLEDYSESLNQPAEDPVEKWALDMAEKARLSGWSSNKDGVVLCPIHSKL